MANTVKTEHVYIVRNKEICGGRPIIKGTRIPVKAVVIYYKMGMTIEEILDGYPRLTPAKAHDALSYYHDHQEEIEKDIEQDSLENILKKYRLTLKENGELVSKNKVKSG